MLTKPASSLLVMSIIGGAVLTALREFISDRSSVRVAMLVPVGLLRRRGGVWSSRLFQAARQRLGYLLSRGANRDQSCAGGS